MSGDLSPTQFEQLSMFVPTREIIDKYDKADAPLGGDPAKQWYGGPDDSGTVHLDLRDRKLDELDVRSWDSPDRKSRFDYFDEARSTHSFPPVAVAKYGDGNVLTDGHHRLAYAEHEGMELMPVRHWG